MEGPYPHAEQIAAPAAADVCWRCGTLAFGCTATGPGGVVLWHLCYGCIGALVSVARRCEWRRNWEREPRRARGLRGSAKQDTECTRAAPAEKGATKL